MARLVSPSRPNKKRRYDPDAPVFYSARTRRHRYASNYFKPYYTASKKDYDRAWKHIAVYKYPFSRRNLQPKIPDGKTLVSLGFSNKISTNITLPNNAQPTDILLFPGLSCYCVIKNAEGLKTQKLTAATDNDKQPTYHTLAT